MTVTDIVRRLNEACTGGLDCQCTYRVAADEILAMRKAMDGPNLAWERMSDTNVRLVDQMAVMQTELDELRTRAAATFDIRAWQKEQAELRAENEAMRIALHNLVATIQSLPEDIEGYIETLDEPMAVAVNLIAKR